MQDTFTAANGDKVMTAITMQLCPIAPGIYHGVGTYVVTGGTGRFATPPAREVFDGTGNFNTGNNHMRVEGHHFDEPPPSSRNDPSVFITHADEKSACVSGI